MTRRRHCLATIHLDLPHILGNNPNWYASVPLVVGLLGEEKGGREGLLTSSSSLFSVLTHTRTHVRTHTHAYTHTTQDTYIQERAEAMENIHSTIVELGSIFKQLAEMVQEQEEQVVR